ncbi:MAG: DUF4190 domain-containing protein [Clostridiales bacterium]|nr:DUF4190 domain-containing protein [Clostridiales bacterium]
MAENKWICPVCGVENDGKFCVACGAPAPVAEAATAASEAVAEAVQTTEAVATEAVAEAAAEAPVAAEAAVEAVAAEAAPEPVYDTTPVEQITEPVVEPVAAEVVEAAYAPVEPAKVDPDEFVPQEPDHSAPVAPVAAPQPAQPVADYSDPDNFVPAPMHPEKQSSGSSSSGSAAASTSAPKPDGYTQALVGLILAIAGCIVPCVGPLCSIAGLILAIIAKNKGYKGGLGTAALIVSIASIVLSLLFTGIVIACTVNNF